MAQTPKILGRINLDTNEVYNKEGKLLKGKEKTTFIIHILNGDQV